MEGLECSHCHRPIDQVRKGLDGELLCQADYRYQRKHLTLERKAPAPGMSDAVVEANVERTDTGCMVWTGATDKDGYPQYYDPERYKRDENPLVVVRRWVAASVVGELAPGQIVETVCDDRLCVQIDHLNVATVATARKTVAGINARKTHCNNNHELTGDNIYLAEGKRRQCMQCRWEASIRSKGLNPEDFVRREHIYTPEMAAVFMRDRGWDPLVVQAWAGTNSPWLCRCTTCHAVYRKQLGNVRDGRADCRNCDFIANAEAALKLMIDSGLEPQVPYRRSGAPWLSKCTRTGLLTAPSHSNIRKMGHQCAICGAERISEALRLSDAQAREQLPAHLVPQGLYPGGILEPWAMFCTDCETLHDSPGISLHNAKRRGKGCPNCGHHGINFEIPGYLYLITHASHNAVKWGIANGELRLQQHAGQGWRPERRWAYARTAVARAVERLIEDYVRDRGVPPALTEQQMPYGGWSETASLGLISLEEVIEEAEDLVRRSKSLF